MIFQTIQDVKKHAAGGINASTPLSTLSAAYRRARRSHVDRYLSAAFVDELEAAVAATEEPTPVVQKAIDYVSEALALLTLYEYSFTAAVQMGDHGLVQSMGENVQGAYKYQTNDYRDWSLTSGLAALDDCLTLLDANPADYTTWAQSAAAVYHRRVLIRTSVQLSEVHSSPTDRRAYEALRPLLEDVQIFVAESLLGEAQLEELLDALDTNSASSHEQELIRRLRRSLAAFTVFEGMQRNMVQLKGGRVIQIESLEPQSSEKQGVPGLNILNLTLKQNKDFAERHLSYVRDYLNTNKAQFPAYVTHLELIQPDPDIDFPRAGTRRRGGKLVRI